MIKLPSASVIRALLLLLCILAPLSIGEIITKITKDNGIPISVRAMLLFFPIAVIIFIFLK
jgi:hypothetical protein